MTDISTHAAALDPEVAAALAALPFDIGAALGSLTDETIGEVRAAMSQMPVPPLTDQVLRTDHEIPGSGGVVVRVHRPVDVKGALPCVYWMHGGGLVLGDFAGDDARFDVWCPQLGCVGVSVQYRLSPETKYPGPLDDCYAGLAWVHQHADELGVDATRLGVGGQSAGAGLAAGLALRARDQGEVPLAFQLLIYPGTDMTTKTESRRLFERGFYLTDEFMNLVKAHYLPDATRWADPEASPLLCELPEGLAPAYLATAGFDPLRDEGEAYARKLADAGVAVELRRFPDQIHGFLNAVGAGRTSRAATAEMAARLAAGLGAGPAGARQ